MREEPSLLTLREYASLAYNVSRPRFWFYVAGPFTVGCIWGAQRATALLTPEFFAYLLYFLLPANVFLYGVNDYWDHDTDRLNPKKGDKEYLVDPSERTTLKVVLIAITVISLALMVFQSWGQRLVFGAFLFLSYFYSAKPLRFKATPILDSTSNFLYALPGVFGYLLFTGKLPPTIIMLAALLHSSAMHLFSAIPDIEWDRDVNLMTSAVKIGERGSVYICLGSLLRNCAGDRRILAPQLPPSHLPVTRSINDNQGAGGLRCLLVLSLHKHGSWRASLPSWVLPDPLLDYSSSQG